MSQKSPPSSFLIFCNKLDFRKVERVPPFTILKSLHFLSLRYTPTLRRFGLVYNRNLLLLNSSVPQINKKVQKPTKMGQIKKVSTTASSSNFTKVFAVADFSISS